MSAPTVMESPAMASSATIRPQPEPYKVDAPILPKSRSGLIIGLVVGAVVLVVMAVGGVLIYSGLKSGSTKASTQGTTTATATTTEITRYWLMLEPASTREKPTRVAGLVPVASGQTFQMRFVFAEEGYVYIFGPGGNTNQPTAFLTTKPAAQTGLDSNHAAAGSEFSFPKGEGLLSLDKKPGTDRFTVVFSKIRLESPSFLSAPFTGEPMTGDQLAEFNSFVSKYMQSSPAVELDDTNSQAPFVRVKVNADQLGNPIVFEIRIQHN